MESLIFDTTFLIDLQRERNARREGAAHRFLKENDRIHGFFPVIVLGEFGAGFLSLNDPAYVSIVHLFDHLPITSEVAAIYARTVRTLRAAGNLIGSNDLWIASVALNSGFPLVTKNSEHFARVPGLELREY